MQIEFPDGPLSDTQLAEFLDPWANHFERPEFITTDPIQIPHRFQKREDREIAGFWTAMLSWGNRTSIIRKCTELMNLMDNAPYDFVLNHQEEDRKRFSSFVHRTFQYADTLYFLDFFQWYYQHHTSLETAFIREDRLDLAQFHELFFSREHLPRTRKHVATPVRKSRCKRINMFLRWMVRSSARAVDFGIWDRISSSQLYVPLDLHVDRVARQLGLLTRKQSDWAAVEELTECLRRLNPQDPVRYDFALFGLSAIGQS